MKKDVYIVLRVTKEEKKEFLEKAKEARVSLSSLIRKILFNRITVNEKTTSLNVA